MQTSWSMLAVSAVLLAGFTVVESGTYPSSDRQDRDNLFCKKGVCEYGSPFPSADGLLCLCYTGFIGPCCELLAEQTLMSCSTYNPCLNHGICETDHDTLRHYCSCRTGWTGNLCETETTLSCSTYIPCRNHGICRVDYHTMRNYCSCRTGWTGNLCETGIITTTSGCSAYNPCLNHGTCIHVDYHTELHSCSCTIGWTGKLCETEIVGCSKPCLNGGTCHYSSNHHCSCKDGYTGDQCETVVCSKPCLHDGTCVRSYYSSYSHCSCKDGWTGDQCESEYSKCDKLCKNGGTCYQTNYVPKCNCKYGWRGENCSESTKKESSPTLSPRNLHRFHESTSSGFSSTGLSIGGVVGVSFLVIALVAFRLWCRYKCGDRRRTVVHRRLRSPNRTPRPPSTIYNPNTRQYTTPRRLTFLVIVRRTLRTIQNPESGAVNRAYDSTPDTDAPTGHEYPAVPPEYSSLPEQIEPPPPYTEEPSTAYSVSEAPGERLPESSNTPNTEAPSAAYSEAPGERPPESPGTPPSHTSSISSLFE